MEQQKYINEMEQEYLNSDEIILLNSFRAGSLEDNLFY